MRIGHAVNFFGTEDPEHRKAQKLVSEGMQRAKEYAAHDGVDVDLICVEHPQSPYPNLDGFVRSQPLERTILDFGDFQVPPLPLIGDIFDRLYATSTAEFLIYTNADIILTTHFYSAIAELVAAGHRAIEIRRHTVTGKLLRECNGLAIPNLSLLSAELGDFHPGHDCFVFHRSLYPQFIWHPVCVGVYFVGRAVLLNLVAASGKRYHVPESHLTFHLGDTRRWKNPAFEQVAQNNREQTREIYRALWARDGPLPPIVDTLFGQPFFQGFDPQEEFTKRK